MKSEVISITLCSGVFGHQEAACRAHRLTNRDFVAENDLLEPLKLAGETVTGLLSRVNQ
ncbi:hypothetical protein [Ottowia thiooxydans]|uniref:hypothetical protein n=1 Tax=Ottowia thiooxydans TaxID=219182 RepID=UPI00339B7989